MIVKWWSLVLTEAVLLQQVFTWHMGSLSIASVMPLPPGLISFWAVRTLMPILLKPTEKMQRSQDALNFIFFLLRRVNICCHLALERRGLVTGWSALEWDSLCLVSVSMNYPALFPTNTQGERSAPNTFSCFYTEPSSVLNEKHGE